MRAVLCAFLVTVGGVLLGSGFGRSESAEPVALLATWKGPIGPASTRYLIKAIEKAEERSARLLILELDTPGGLVTSMREMISAILGARFPIIGFVAPPGAHAASAGTYIIYACQVAAMAPGTNIGAATPIQLGGSFPGLPERKDDTDGKKPAGDADKDGNASDHGDKPAAPEDAGSAKAVNDAVAFIRSLAEIRHRNAEWAEAAVRQASSLSASDALKKNVVDVVAEDVPALLRAVNGRTVSVGDRKVTLETGGLAVERFAPSALIEFLALVTDPNIALILMLIGVYGLFFEFANPGTVGPGVVGTISLILGLFALNQLPIDYAGLALLFVGLGLMVAEALTPTFGVLGAGGVVAFVIGAVLLIDTDVPAFRISWSVIGTMAATSFAFLTLLLAYVWRSQRQAVVTGQDAVTGAPAQIIDWTAGEGHVWFNGERWQACGPQHLGPGDVAIVDRMEGLTLVLRDGDGRADTGPR
jgi:membrane-bound serine protease (ClpP class)